MKARFWVLGLACVAVALETASCSSGGHTFGDEPDAGDEAGSAGAAGRTGGGGTGGSSGHSNATAGTTSGGYAGSGMGGEAGVPMLGVSGMSGAESGGSGGTAGTGGASGSAGTSSADGGGLGGIGGMSMGGAGGHGGQSSQGGGGASAGGTGGAAPCGGANLKTDPTNCGTCGNDCTASVNIAHPELVTCKSGVCAIPDGACATGKRHCTSVTTDVCETNITTVANCGDCGIKCDSTQVCSAGQCLLKDGNPCGTKADCQSNVCTTFYQDADGDKHGTASVAKAVCGTTAPAGYVASNDDCCDTGADAASIFPGQAAYFGQATTSCNKGFDYNCANGAELQDAQLISVDCYPGDDCASVNNNMWDTTTLPACGTMAPQRACVPGAISTDHGMICATSQQFPPTLVLCH